jgi:hypothetical protein
VRHSALIFAPGGLISPIAADRSGVSWAAYTGRMGKVAAEGWYRDPYAIHEDRWMSQGQPTKLVRDAGIESYDPPPDLPLPDVLVPVTAGTSASSGDSDLHRSDDAGQEDPYSAKRAGRAVLDALSGGAIVDEPGGDW